MLPEHAAAREPSKPSLEQAFAESRAKLLRMLWQRLPRELAPRVDPEEILHKAFIKAQQAWDRFERSGLRPYVWLYRIALDTLLDERDWNLRQRRDLRREVALPDGSSAQFDLGLINGSTTPSGAEARRELQERVRHVLEQLKPEDRDILCMRYLDELTTEEVAQVLDLKDSAARQRYARARLRFKDLWKALYGLEGMEE
jgi:RNA polymerase sigma-70 factor (ECF subfamily)